jgi:REP element-mobilizing transposase RayT
MQRKRVFRLEKDFESFLKGMKETCERWEARIGAYCLMPNHYHLLIQTPLANLPRIMRHIDGAYTQRFNRRHNRDGPLFRGRYKAILIDAEAYLAEVLKYIHQNPRRSELEKRLGQYPWSSHKGYLSKAHKWSWLSTEAVFKVIAGERVDVRKAYLDMMKEGLTPNAERFYSLKNIKSILGGSGFVQWVKDEFSDILHHEEIPESYLRNVSLEDVMKAVREYYDIEEETLCTPRRGIPNEARAMSVYLARKHTGETLRHIASRFGMKRHSSAGSTASRFAEKMSRSRALKLRVREVEKTWLRQAST